MIQVSLVADTLVHVQERWCRGVTCNDVAASEYLLVIVTESKAGHMIVPVLGL
jgi:hypothetical protein